MQTIYIHNGKQSGNHGRENSKQVENLNGNNGIGTSKPQLTKNNFIAPASVIPRKATSPIKEFNQEKTIPEVDKNIDNDEKTEKIDEKVVTTPLIISAKDNKQSDVKTVESEVQKSTEVEEIKTENVKIEEVEEVKAETTKPQQIETITTDILTSTNESLSQEQWNEMLDVLFEKIPTIHSPLKNYLPALHNQILTVRVKNDIQLEHFSKRKRDVIAYLRSHFKLTIDEITVVLDTNLESKKIIYDHKDKIEYLREENPELANFMSILKLTIKE